MRIGSSEIISMILFSRQTYEKKFEVFDVILYFSAIINLRLSRF